MPALAFDAVFGQNDRMARGAWEALGKPEKLPLLGVDALPEGGLQDVLDGVLTTTYIYPTRGDLVMKLAMDILAGNDYPRETMLESALVDSHNAAMVLMQEHEITDQRAEGYASGADAYISKPFSEKVLLSRIGNLLKSRLQLKHYYLENGTSDASEQENDFLSRFRSYAKVHLADPDLNVEQLASELSLSRVQLYRKVKALTGYSPVEVIRIMRLKEAEKRLKNTDKTVAEIAYDVGFSSPSYFSKCYRELFGVLPGTSR